MGPLNRWPAWLPLSVVAVWGLVNVVLVYQNLLLSKPPLHWDEASHSLQGLLILADVGAGDLLALFLDTYRQVYWPPAFSWIAATFFLVLGASDEAARLSSLVWLFPLALVLYQAGRRMFPLQPWVTGLLAAGMAITSMALADMGSYAMLEAPGLLAFSTGLWLYLRLLDRPTVPGAIILGAALTLTYLTKSNYGVLLVLAIAIERLFHARMDPRAAFWAAPTRYAFSVLVLALAGWFAYPAKLRSAWAALVNYPYGTVDAYSMDGLLFYPRALASMIPVWLVLLALAAVGLSFTRLSNPRLRLPLILVFLQLAFATWSVTKLDRHIVTMLPPLFLLVAYWVAYLAHRVWMQRSPAVRSLAIIVPLLLLAGSSQLFYSQLLAGRAVQDSADSHGLFRYLAAFSREGPLLVTGDVDIDPPPIDWYLATWGGMPVFSAGTLREHDEDQWRSVSAVLPPLAGVLSRLPERSQKAQVTRSLYSGLPMDRPQLLTESEYTEAVWETASGYGLPVVAVIETPESARLFRGRSLEQKLLAGGYRVAEIRSFPFPSAEVRLYRR